MYRERGVLWYTGGTEPETGTHHTDATGGDAGSTGSAQGLSMSGGRVESTSFIAQGLNAVTNFRVGDRSVAVAASMDQIGIRGRAIDASGQSSAPPPPTAASRCWGSLANGNTLVPGAILEAGDNSRGTLRKILEAPVFDGTEVSYPS